MCPEVRYLSLWSGWSCDVKVSCILCHLGVQLKLAYIWARPAILVAGKGRGGMFLFLLFLHFHSCSSFFPVPLFHLLCYPSYLFLPFSGRWHKMSHKGWRVVKPQHNQNLSLWSICWCIAPDKVLFSTKNTDIFLISPQKICCGYSLEAPEYPQHIFLVRNKKNLLEIPPLIWSYVDGYSLEGRY